MLNAVIIIVALLLAGYLAFSKRLATSSNWKATVTPLASIMGSGFFVSAPLLGGMRREHSPYFICCSVWWRSLSPGNRRTCRAVRCG
jgi:hypothetical protein